MEVMEDQHPRRCRGVGRILREDVGLFQQHPAYIRALRVEVSVSLRRCSDPG